MNFKNFTKISDEKLLLKSYIKIDNIDVSHDLIHEYVLRNKKDYIDKQIKIRIDSHYDKLRIPESVYSNYNFGFSLGTPRAADGKNSFYFLLSIYTKDEL